MGLCIAIGLGRAWCHGSKSKTVATACYLGFGQFRIVCLLAAPTTAEWIEVWYNVIRTSVRFSHPDTLMPDCDVVQRGLARSLVEQGARRPNEVAAMTLGEARRAFFSLIDYDDAFVARLIAQAAVVAQRRVQAPKRQCVVGEATDEVETWAGLRETKKFRAGVRNAETGLHALGLLLDIRETGVLPAPSTLAVLVRAIHDIDEPPSIPGLGSKDGRGWRRRAVIGLA